MHKILLAFFLLVVFFFPKAEIYAKFVQGCSTAGNVDPTPISTSTISRMNRGINEVDCPDDAICSKPKNVARNEYDCFKAAETPATDVPVAPIDPVGAPPPTVVAPAAPAPPAPAAEAAGGKPKCKKNSGLVCPALGFVPILGLPASQVCKVAPVVGTVYECTDGTPSTQDSNCVCDIATIPKRVDCSVPGNCTGGSGQACTPGSPDPNSKGPGGIRTAIGCIPTEPKALVEGLLKFGTLAAGGIAFIIMLLAALQMITAEGNPESIKAGQEKFYSAIIGLLLIIFAVLLMQVIGVDILNLPGFGRRGT